MKIGRVAKACWTAVWFYIWITAFNHYYEVMEAYADAGVYNSNPVIYSAVESWFLLTLIMLMWLSWKLIEVVSND